MADKGGLQLLPGTRKKLDIKTPGENRFFYIGIIVLAIVLALGIGMYFYQVSLQDNLDYLDQELINLDKQRDTNVENNLLTLNKQIALVTQMLAQHNMWTVGFSQIEGALQGQIQFRSLSASTNQNQIDFKAIAANYSVIAKQMAAFVADDAIKNVTLENVDTMTTGRLEFGMRLVYDPVKFIKQQQNEK